ncbi:pyridoxal phosphate-dependent aminotransferase [uncultured Roseobacter sp.]|uniref:pyridoxal phosphate-dependent aminotransferase n=1 Tax=uncultured Roseobacter sp. TaxID=114847 RepID=UPI002619BAB8|nr:pyridoxal phosphate-dependent aminotransferase [uncultured Roseobacter sp.]
MTRFRLTPLVDSLPDTVPFVGPETQERARGQLFDARLGANENVFGPSPMATRVMAETPQWMYGDPESFELREALADHHGIEMASIVVGEGIDGLLGYLLRLMVGPGDTVVTTEGGYPTFNYHATGYGGVIHTVPYKNDHEDPKALFAKAAEVDAKLVYMANPDNPMGTALDNEALLAAMETLPKDALLVLDEAYLEFAHTDVGLDLPLDDPRVIRLRTFSKAYGLAGARIGYAMGAPELIAAFDKVRNHFGINRAAQAGALAALTDQTWLRSVQARVVTSRNRIGQIARANGLKPLKSQANFVTVDCCGTAEYARAVLNEVVARGVFIRMPFSAPQNRCIRISCGTPAQLEILEDVLSSALRAVGTGLTEAAQ